MSARKIHLLMIDPQNDFCIASGPGGEKGQLVVGGADADMARLAAFITKNRKRIEEIHCTLDSHQSVHIAHPIFWVNSKGEHPPIFSTITADDVKNGTWKAFYPPFQKRAQNYVDTLAKNGRYQLMIWPPHCLIGSWGHSIVPAVQAALVDWEIERFNKVNFVAKGSNLFTEHYSGVQADVPDDNDPSTKLNTNLIDALTDADEIVITGEALSHCVANTVRDVAVQFGVDNVKKFTLLQDTSSNVYQCEKLGRDFVLEMAGKGMKLTTTKDW
jgi:nicotinamidase-related amidase